MDAGQPLVTSNGMGNSSGDHHKAITLILEFTCKSIKCNIICATYKIYIKHIIFVIRRNIVVPGVCPCIRICAMVHHVHTREAMVGRKN